MALTDKLVEIGSGVPARRQQAAEWYLQLSEGVTTDAQMSQWLAWVQADPRNLESFGDISRLANGLYMLDPVVKGKLAEELIEPLPLARRSRFRMHALYAGLAAAAAVVAVIFGFYRFLPALQGPVVNGMYFTQKGAAIRNLTLADGTRVSLGPGSALDVEYEEGRRRVVLRTGEAFFAVKHDARRPFDVRVGGFEVSDVGTEFDVQKVNDFISVAVTRGAVDLSLVSPPVKVGPGGDELRALRLVGGEGVHAEVSDDSMPVVMPVDTAGVASWRKGLLRFNDVPLSVVFASINRYSRQQIVANDPEIQRLHYTGTVYTDRVGEWLAAVERTFNLRADTVDGSNGAEIVVKPAAHGNALPEGG